MKFSNCRLGTKLGTTFFAIVALTVALGLFAVMQLSKVNANTEEIALKWMPSVKVLGELSDATNEFRRAESQHLLAADTKEMDEIERRLDKGRQGLAAVQRKYEPLISSDQERTAYESFKRNLEVYYGANTKMVSL